MFRRDFSLFSFLNNPLFLVENLTLTFQELKTYYNLFVEILKFGIWSICFPSFER